MTDISQYGFQGACIVGLGVFIMYIMKSHNDERTEFRKTIERQFEEANRNTKENTSILSELASLLKNKK